MAGYIGGSAVGDHITRTIFNAGGEEMEALRQSSQHGKIVPTATGISPHQTQQGQGLVTLLVMITILCIIMTYCCWGAPCCRAFCRRHCCFQMNLQDDLAPSSTSLDYRLEQGTATPTIILLPYGRMLVVDTAVFAQLQADTTGLDLLELGENVHRQLTGSRYSSTPSILEIDSETTSKNGISPVQETHPPPTYDSLFSELPPSYSQILNQLIAAADVDVERGVRNETDNDNDMRESQV